MKRPRRRLRWTAVTGLATVLAAGALAAPALAGTASARSAIQGPTVKLIAAQKSITVGSYRGQVFLDPGVYVAAIGSALQFDVQRASYTKPITITQVIQLPDGSTRTRPLPGSVLDGFYGLKNFIRLSVTNSSGKVVASSTQTFCPNGFAQRVSPGSPSTSPYPTNCGNDPFPRSLVMGVAKGWAVDPSGGYGGFGGGGSYKLPVGTYKATVAVTPVFRRLLRISAADATASVKVTVTKGIGCGGRVCGGPAATPARAVPALAKVPTLTHPPAAALPDLIPLPSWGITTFHDPRSGRDLLNFGATVSVVGNSPLDVEGFRSNGSPIMQAYQYFWRSGHVIGRVRAGTMGFDSQHGHNHWHFESFARYQLLGAAKNVALRSHKVGFCIAPTDPVSLLIPHAVWQPSFTGLGGACGSPTALWVQEMMPIGWADTYVQSVAGQSFDITSVPNGTYYIQITANPLHVLYESNTRNDISLRKVILGGTAGHRTVTVPAWHGIDPEH